MASVDYFLRIDGIEGESQDARHRGEIDVESFSWGEAQVGSSVGTGGGGAGKVSMQDFHFVMRVNKASPKLFLACADGRHLKSAILTGRKAGREQAEFIKWTFSDVLITSFQTGGGASGEVLPMDQVSLNFSRVEVEYREQKADGSVGGVVTAGWDLKANKPV